MQAKSHFAELGMSSSHVAKPKAEESKGMTTYPDQHLDQIQFFKPLVLTLKMPVIVWKEEDDRLTHMINTMKSE